MDLTSGLGWPHFRDPKLKGPLMMHPQLDPRDIVSNSRKALLSAAMFLAALVSDAQTVSTYSFTQSSGSYTSITGGTQLFSEGDNIDDETPVAVTIPAFWFSGAYYTTMYVGSNGFVTFGSAPN
ncbi:MAG TPA: hypothetical protein PK760_15875, partial [Flavobacteriales bacterium]|nr:hypothetical protein [Flavobacteriales bacterium]